MAHPPPPGPNQALYATRKLVRGRTDSSLMSSEERIDRLREGLRTMFREHVHEEQQARKPSLWSRVPARLRPSGSRYSRRSPSLTLPAGGIAASLRRWGSS